MCLWSPQPVLGDLLFVSETVLFDTQRNLPVLEQKEALQLLYLEG
jgi:hypothetical protein